MERVIVGYRQEANRDWVAELSCGHDQPVHHDTPSTRNKAAGGAGVGASLDCPSCDRAELPAGLRMVRSTPEWDEHTIPPALRRSHRVAAGTWGRIVVAHGQLRFSAATDPPLRTVVETGRTQPIPPDVDHHVQPVGPLRFTIEFLAVDRTTMVQPTKGQPGPEGAKRFVTDQGGDPACWAGLLCEDCGVVLDGGTHRAGYHNAPAS
jgi:tellurite methyltransferase